MKVVLSEEQELFSATIRALLAHECPTTLVRGVLDDPATIPGTLWRRLVEQSIFGLGLPEPVGGEGGTLLDLALFHREAGYALVPTPILNSIGFGVAVSLVAKESMAKRLLAPLLAGELRATVALSAADDAADCKPRVHGSRDGQGWIVTGRLSYVPDVAEARALLLPVVFGRDGIGVVCLDPATPGVKQHRLATQSRQSQSHVMLRDVHIRPEDVVVAPERDSSHVQFRVRLAANALATLQAAEAVGGAERVLDRTVEHVLARHQFGRPLGAFQAVAHHIADMRIAVQGARLTAFQAAWAVGRGDLAEREVVIAALTCHQAFKRNTLTAHQLHGGMGYLRETDLHLWSERAKLLELRGGSREILLRRLALELGQSWNQRRMVANV